MQVLLIFSFNFVSSFLPFYISSVIKTEIWQVLFNDSPWKWPHNMLILTHWLITALSYQSYLKMYFTDTFRIIIIKVLLAKIWLTEPFRTLGHTWCRTVRSEKKHAIYEYHNTNANLITKPKNISSISFSFQLSLYLIRANIINSICRSKLIS
jgi:hypothetical protein